MSSATKSPFFARFIQTTSNLTSTNASRVRTGLQAGQTLKYPSDLDEELRTLKYPSDGDDGSYGS